jgi:hypothetical protein
MLNNIASTKHYDIPEENEWNDTCHPLFEQYNIDLVLQGHQHNYQRTYPIKYNSDTLIDPIITDINTNNYTDPEGQIFVTAVLEALAFITSTETKLLIL